MRFFALATLLSLASAAPAALEARALEARALVSDRFPWPTSVKANGNIQYQYEITPGSNGQYTIGFFNSAPSNSGAVYVYTVAAVGEGNDGTNITKTFAAGQSTSFTIQQSGTEVDFKIDYA